MHKRPNTAPPTIAVTLWLRIYHHLIRRKSYLFTFFIAQLPLFVREYLLYIMRLMYFYSYYILYSEFTKMLLLILINKLIINSLTNFAWKKWWGLFIHLLENGTSPIQILNSNNLRTFFITHNFEDPVNHYSRRLLYRNVAVWSNSNSNVHVTFTITELFVKE